MVFIIFLTGVVWLERCDPFSLAQDWLARNWPEPRAAVPNTSRAVNERRLWITKKISTAKVTTTLHFILFRVKWSVLVSFESPWCAPVKKLTISWESICITHSCWYSCKPDSWGPIGPLWLFGVPGNSQRRPFNKVMQDWRSRGMQL